MRKVRVILLRCHFSADMASTMTHCDHVLRYLLLLGLSLSVVDLLGVMIDMATACLVLLLARRLANIEEHTLQMLLLH